MQYDTLVVLVSSYKFIFFMLCVLLPKILIETVRYDLIFDKTTRGDYGRQYPGIDKLHSLIKLFIKYQVICLSMSYISINCIAKGMPIEELVKQVIGLSRFSIPDGNAFWKVAAICAVALFLVDVLRYIAISRKIYDVFISYKSDDAEIVREIAERLISSGLNVWFAEYEILLSWRGMFQWNINKGIKLSKYALAFTSDEYAKSKHCHEEMRRLLIHLGTDKVIEINMQQGNKTREKFPELKNCPSIDFNGNIDSTIDFIRQITGFEIQPSIKTTASNGNQDIICDNFIYRGNAYLVNLTGWKFISSTNDGLNDLHLYEYKKINDKCGLFMNFYARRDDERSFHDNGKLNDRDYYNNLLKYARKYFWKHMPATPIGVHLFFHDGKGQLALTYWVKKGRPYWSRKFSVIAKPPNCSYPVEVAFTFGFKGQVSYADFCRYACVMEETVKSLQWQ